MKGCSHAETQALSILWFHPPLGSWNPVHSTSRWKREGKSHTRNFGGGNRTDLNVVLVASAHLSLPGTQLYASSNCKGNWN